MRRLAVLLLAGTLCACAGGSHQHAEIANPYIDKARALTQAGMGAMQRQRWAYARSAFERALEAAELTDDPTLIAQAWYNLGMARKSGGQMVAAGNAFRSAWASAERAHDPVTVLRARLALALLQKHSEWHPGAVPAKLPPDIHLSAGRLAERQQRTKVAEHEYRLALKRSGGSRQGVIYRGQAYLGLGLLASEGGDGEMARRQMRQALALFRQAGVPRMIAYTLLQLSKHEPDGAKCRDDLRRAMTIYRAMDDEAGQKACAEALKQAGFAE